MPNRQEQRRNKLVFALAQHPRGSVIPPEELNSILKFTTEELNATIQVAIREQLLNPTGGGLSLSNNGHTFVQFLRDEEAESQEIQQMMAEIQAEQRAKAETEKRMAKSRSEPVGTASISPAEGLRLLSIQLDKGRALLSTAFTENQLEAWKIGAELVLTKALGANTDTFNDISQRNVISRIFMGGESESQLLEDRKRYLSQYLERIEHAGMDVLRLEMELQTRTTASPAPATQPSGATIFIVHGHDEVTKLKVQLFLSKLRLDSLVLVDYVSEGKGVLDKLITAGDEAGFAIVLMTGDDVGRSKAEPDLKPRARQNVIFELGYFIGRLGRRKVCALYQAGVERLTDFDSVYVPLDDAGAWEKTIARELQAAGYQFEHKDLLK